MIDTLTLWTHALAAFGFALLAGWTAQAPEPARSRWPIAVAFGTIALWALTLAALDAGEPAIRLAETIRTLALLGMMVALHRRGDTTAPVGLGPVYGVVMLVALAILVLELAAGVTDDRIAATCALLRMMVALAALVLTQNLRTIEGGVAPPALVLACALLWAGDLTAATTAYLSTERIGSVAAMRGALVLGAAALAAAALFRRHGVVRVSRSFAYQSLSLVGIGGYFVLLALATSAIGAVGGALARTLQTAFVFGSTATLLTLISSTWLRAWIKVKIAKHLFRHRYDYRAEWMRFSGTLGGAGDAASLDERVIKALCDITDSPAGLLLVPEGEGLGIGAGWNWTAGGEPRHAGDAAFRHLLAGTGHIVDLDAERADRDRHDRVTPQWLVDRADAWAVAPLLHLDSFAGAVVLGQPPVTRALDWEDLDLLRVAGRQAASHLAGARARDALDQAARFDEFNRRFAFIVHDIKNLVSGLTLLARNAERHADNPAFRADMVATVQDSAAKLGALLARLSQQPRIPAGPPAPVAVAEVVASVAGAHRGSHPVVLRAGTPALALADRATLEQMLDHLVRNAIEASPPNEPVVIDVVAGDDAVIVSVIDRGCGMSPAFVRDQLFRPFASSKRDGFGIGAYEARQLAQGFGATIEVDSREGEGSAFHVRLRAALPVRLEQAA